MMGSLGFEPPDRMARLASLGEIGAGVLIATGTAAALGPMMLTSIMGVAAGNFHLKNRYFNQNQGFEINAMYATLALLLAVEDHGSFSVDETTGVRAKMSPAIGLLAVAAGIGNAAFMLSRRQSPHASAGACIADRNRHARSARIQDHARDAVAHR